jgi:hypothetical protein
MISAKRPNGLVVITFLISLLSIFYGFCAQRALALSYEFDEGVEILTEGLLFNKKGLLQGKKIAVFGIIESKSKKQWEISPHIEDGIVDVLVNEGYTVIERRRIDDVIKKEIKKGTDWWYDASQVAQFGKLVGADVVITGSYVLWGTSLLKISIRAINVTDGKIFASKKVKVLTDRIRAFLKTDGTTSAVTNRDGVYVAYANGIVKDTKTGLEWKAGPDRAMSWNEAMSWVQSLNLDGGGWRMPNIDELKGLYKKGKGDRNMTPLLKTTGWTVWSGETGGSSDARIFYFVKGFGLWYSATRSGTPRAFAVRSRGDG